uniref:Uncharacterized protein n=1 Tax=Oryza brachyantha TaxID=4533 RepID=J3MTH6_ORYBR
MQIPSRGASLLGLAQTIHPDRICMYKPCTHACNEARKGLFCPVTFPHHLGLGFGSSAIV